jgi:uncharacterized protein (DUF2141 family)
MSENVSVRYTTTTEVDTLKKYHGQIEFFVYAAEQLCAKSADENLCPKCPFRSTDGWCALKEIRSCIGDGMKQEDVTLGKLNEVARKS